MKQKRKWRYAGNATIMKYNPHEAPKEGEMRNILGQNKTPHTEPHTQAQTRKNCNRSRLGMATVGVRGGDVGGGGRCGWWGRGVNKFWSCETSPPMLMQFFSHIYSVHIAVLYLICETSQWNTYMYNKKRWWNKTTSSIAIWNQNTRKTLTEPRWARQQTDPASILYKSIVGRYWPVSYADGPITARYRFM